MISRVLISKKLLSEFRKQVTKAYPAETMSTLWGRIEGDTVVVSSLRVPKQEGTSEELTYHFADAVGDQARVRGEHYLGTIHSHPECLDSTPSQHDWDTSYGSGERVFGIMRVEKSSAGRFTTEVAWWEPRPRIATVHPRVRDANRDSQLQTKSKAVQALREVSGEDSPALSVPPVHVQVHSETGG